MTSAVVVPIPSHAVHHSLYTGCLKLPVPWHTRQSTMRRVWCWINLPEPEHARQMYSRACMPVPLHFLQRTRPCSSRMVYPRWSQSGQSRPFVVGPSPSPSSERGVPSTVSRGIRGGAGSLFNVSTIGSASKRCEPIWYSCFRRSNAPLNSLNASSDPPASGCSNLLFWRYCFFTLSKPQELRAQNG